MVRRLGLVGPGPKAFFRDACLLADAQADLETSAHLLAHVLRETMSGVEAILEELVMIRAATAGDNVNKERHKLKILGIMAGSAFRRMMRPRNFG